MPDNRMAAGHPGPFVRAHTIEALELSVKEAATVLGITRTALSAFLNARAALSPDMALRIEKAFGLSVEQLMHMQCDYDIAQARMRQGDILVQRYAPVDLERVGQKRAHQ